MVVIMPYKSDWPEAFEKIGKPLRQALGALALRIDHIGSTAVPGLASKNLIDVQITVESLAPAVGEALRQAGYARIEFITHDHVPPGRITDAAEWSKWFFKPAFPVEQTGQAVNVHVRLLGRANQRYALLFRDYLRTHAAIAEAYAQVKQALVAHQMDDQDAYYDVKDPVCDIIIGGAEAWAAAVGWKLGPTDC